MLKQLGKEPVKCMMKADPARQNVKVDHLIWAVVKFNRVEDNRLIFRAIEPIIRHCAYHQNMVHHSGDSSDESRDVCFPVGFTVDFDDTGERERDVKDADPGIGLVLYVVRHRALVRVDTHEHLTHLGEAQDEIWVLGDDRLDGVIGTNVP